ncbi:MAG: hypothetical protein COA84_09685 [Robiginitomaculum sp.]|nr:MAG: hypothetical protein COA84_09685 [Robiginitomaculum sp.]
MKKLSQKKKIKKIRHDKKYLYKLAKRRGRSCLFHHKDSTELSESKKLYARQITAVGRFEGKRRKIPIHGVRKAFDLPENLDFEGNYDTSLKCLLGIRALGDMQRRNKFNYYLEFSLLKNISPAALLVLTAELDCRVGYANTARRKGQRLPADSQKWNPHITALFQDFGIFELLCAQPEVRMTYGDKLKAVKFRRGTTQDGDAALRLIHEIVEVTGNEPNSQERLWEGIGEAVANVLDHAYPHPYVSYPAKRIAAWWAGAIYDNLSHTTHFMVYDRGIGLPASLPKKEGFQALLARLAISNPTEAHLVWAAIKNPQSSTLLGYRGEGLRQMAEVVDNHKGSSLQILSGNASMTYLGGENKILKNLPVEFCGTLIEWRIKHERSYN